MNVFTTDKVIHAHDLALVNCLLCGCSYRDHDMTTLACPVQEEEGTMKVGDRVLWQGQATGVIQETAEKTAYVHLGHMDGAPVRRWVPLDELSPAPKSVEQVLEDLL